MHSFIHSYIHMEGIILVKKYRVTIAGVILIALGAALVYRALPYSWWRQALGAYPFAGQKKAVRQGERLYKIRCAGCHDDKFISVLKRFNDGRFLIPDYYRIVTYGHGAMTGFGDRLTAGERWKIVGYILDGRGRRQKE